MQSIIIIIANDAYAQSSNNNNNNDNSDMNVAYSTIATDHFNNAAVSSNGTIAAGESQGGGNATTLITSVYKSVQHSVVYVRPHLISVGITGSLLQANASATTELVEGSGWVYDTSGHIITNAHVIAGLDSTYDVSFPDGNTYTANVIGLDPFSDL